MGELDQKPAGNPAVGNNDLNNGVGALSALIGMIPLPGSQLVSGLLGAGNGALGVASAANGVGTGSTQLDEDVNAAGLGAGIGGTLASLGGAFLGSGTGVSALLGLAPAAGEVAATTATGAALGGAGAAAGVVGAGVGGYAYGRMWDEWMRGSAITGKDDQGKDRSFSDMAGDHGWAAHEGTMHTLEGWGLGHGAADTIGDVAGIGTVLGESVLGTAGAIASAPVAIGSALYKGVKGLF